MILRSAHARCARSPATGRSFRPRDRRCRAWPELIEIVLGVGLGHELSDGPQHDLAPDALSATSTTIGRPQRRHGDPRRSWSRSRSTWSRLGSGARSRGDRPCRWPMVINDCGSSWMSWWWAAVMPLADGGRGRAQRAGRRRRGWSKAAWARELGAGPGAELIAGRRSAAR
jgi:hypothetical protein